MSAGLQRSCRRRAHLQFGAVGGVSKYFAFGSSHRKAEKALQEIEKRIAKGEVSFSQQETSQIMLGNGTQDIRIEELAHRHLEWVKSSRSQGTFEIRQHHVLQFLNHVGARMVSQIGVPELEAFRSWSGKQKPKMRNPGSEALRHIRTMFRWADENGLCDMPVRRFPEIRIEPPQTKTLSQEELATLLDKAPPDFKDMIHFGIVTGLRPQELRTLKAEHLLPDADGGCYLLIEKHKTSRHSSTPKPRTVPLGKDATEIWRRCIKDHSKSEFIFLNDDGEPYSARTYRQRFRRLCKRAGIREVAVGNFIFVVVMASCWWEHRALMNRPTDGVHLCRSDRR